MATTPADIKAKFKVYFDNMSFNLKNGELNRVFEKAQDAYWNSLAKNWNTTLENSIDIAPIAKRLTITPTSNVILYTELPNYERIGFVKPTYTVDGETYSFPAKPVSENQKYSVLNNGTYRYPRFYESDNGIVLEPSTTPTSLFCTYLREFYPIDFDAPADVIPYTEANVQGIIMIALQNVGVSQRENDQAQALIQENAFNKQ